MDTSKKLFRVMGPPAIERAEIQPLKHHKIAVLIAYLSVFGTVSRERLAGLFWPELPQKKASANLRGAIHKLKGLAPESVTAQGDQVSLSPSWRVDLALLLQAENFPERREASHYRGMVCEGVQLPECDELEQWLTQLREDAHSASIRNLCHLSEMWLEAGESEKAVAAARSAVSREPLSEMAHGQLIKSLVEAGDQPAARRQFQLLEETLEVEFGTAPSEETKTLLADRPNDEAPGHNLPSSLTELLGRGKEKVELTRAITESRLVTITGIGGVGKTAVALETARGLTESGAFPQGVWLLKLAPLTVLMRGLQP